MNENTRAYKLKTLFATHPTVDVFHLTADDKAFFKPTDAHEHSKKLDDHTVTAYNRKNVEADIELLKQNELLKQRAENAKALAAQTAAKIAEEARKAEEAKAAAEAKAAEEAEKKALEEAEAIKAAEEAEKKAQEEAEALKAAEEAKLAAEAKDADADPADGQGNAHEPLTEPTDDLTIAQLQAWLDAQGAEYAKGATKAVYLDLAQKIYQSLTTKPE